MDMYTQHLKKIVEKLVLFERTPKEIKGRQINEWFKIGEDIFLELYNLGVNINWNLSFIKNNTEVSEVIVNVEKNQEWIQAFINIYPNLRIDLDLTGSAGDICKIRSGIEVLLKGFVDVDTHFNKILAGFEEFGEVDELDRLLKIWKNTGHRPDFAPSDNPSAAPASHWWWK